MEKIIIKTLQNSQANIRSDRGIQVNEGERREVCVCVCLYYLTGNPC